MIINRSSVPSDPEKNVKATEDVFLLILHAHVVAAAKIVLQTSQISELSNVAEVAAATVRHFINLDLFNPHTHSDGVISLIRM